MADIAPLTPQQPGLRSFIVYDQIRESDLVFEVTGEEADPHLQPGDFALVDTTDREPNQGELFLVEFMNGRRQICETVERFGCYVQNGVSEEKNLWWLRWKMNIRSLSGAVNDRATYADGPYDTTQVTGKIVGKVVGIYEPDFRLQLAA